MPRKVSLPNGTQWAPLAPYRYELPGRGRKKNLSKLTFSHSLFLPYEGNTGIPVKTDSSFVVDQGQIPLLVQLTTRREPGEGGVESSVVSRNVAMWINSTVP
jgi:hypothetical protein